MREALGVGGRRGSTSGAEATIAAFRPAMPRPQRPVPFNWRSEGNAALAGGFGEPGQTAFTGDEPSAEANVAPADPATVARPLGAARAQIHETYIVTQTEDGLVIVDQHAAHERLVYERLKRSLAERGVARQILLIPEIVELSADDADRIAERAEELAEVGLAVERFGRAPSRCARRRPCSAWWTPAGSSATLPTRSPNGSAPRR